MATDSTLYLVVQGVDDGIYLYQVSAGASSALEEAAWEEVFSFPEKDGGVDEQIPHGAHLLLVVWGESWF